MMPSSPEPRPQKVRRRPKHIIVGVGALAIGALVIGLLLFRNSAASVVPVTVVNPALDLLPTVIFADGTLSYRNEVALTSEILGAVQEIYIHEGDKVKSGQPLMKLRSQQYEAQLEQRLAGRNAEIVGLESRRSALQLAQARLKRYTELRAKQLISSDNLEEVKASFQQADAEFRESIQRIRIQRALVTEVEDTLRKSIVRSPIDGTVLSVDVSVGETAVPSALSFSGSTVARVADTSVLVATAKLGEYDVWKIRPKATARVIVPALDETPLAGIVRTVSMAPTSIAGASGAMAASASNYEVVIDIENTRRSNLRTGMTCRVEFPEKKHEPVLTVPIAALISDSAENVNGNEGTVLVVRMGVLTEKKVTLGAANETRQEVRRGLSAEDLVVVPAAGQAPLKAGARVRVISHERS